MGDDNHVGDDYFLTSGDKIRFFLEEDAVDSEGKLIVEKNRAVNKIGHGKWLVELLVIQIPSWTMYERRGGSRKGLPFYLPQSRPPFPPFFFYGSSPI